MVEHVFRLLDFNVYNIRDEFRSQDENGGFKDTEKFMVQMFGLDEKGLTYSVDVDGFRPFFYVKVGDEWSKDMKDQFIKHLIEKMSKSSFYSESITDNKLIRRHDLYGFDNKKEHKFIFIEFYNTKAYNKAKNLWYSDYNSGHILLKGGYEYNGKKVQLYEANLPPLLRFFHIKDISPSGWVSVLKKKVGEMKGDKKTTLGDIQFATLYKYLVPLNHKETPVPYKIMSFDIEASSSHGDFPIPIKTYKKLATNIVEHFENIEKSELTKDTVKSILFNIILTAFGYENVPGIDLVYPKAKPASREAVINLFDKWVECKVKSVEKSADFIQANTLESIFDKIAKEFDKKAEGDDNADNNDSDSDCGDNVIAEFDDPKSSSSNYVAPVKEYADKKATIIDVILDKTFEREGKLIELNKTLNSVFPRLEGDKVTFIGSTIMKYGDKDPYFNHCIVLNSCSPLPMENTVIETYDTEQEVLLAWRDFMQRENPDVIIGYNIFGFDYEFMFRRAEENLCVEEFLKLSRNIDEICGQFDPQTGKWKIEETSIRIASGQHDLRYIKINGRLQVDLYNFWRRNENLTSYKLDYVAGDTIGDFIDCIKYNNDENESVIETGNMTGLLNGSYIHIEEIGHSVDYYAEGAKFLVTCVDRGTKSFKLKGFVNPDKSKKIRWCLAKDDVSPKDIFRLSNGTADDRAIVAKYCIQDCNLVHYLFNKKDILTGYIEMAKICSVPMNFLVMRGQGIKLQSLIAKECREVKTLMPVIDKGDLDEGYEGAIVLPPKCNLYLDNPIACNDYASLYPSSMISENLSHDSKVKSIEYDLAGNVVEEWGCKDVSGNYIYDNLPGYEYVDVPYDTYKYIRKNPKAKAEKIKVGYKVCRFAQFPDGQSAIMPNILKKLLKARKDTRALQKKVDKSDFMWGVLEQRQLGYKVTANSLYGGCGAKTSTFYEKDIAACTTAMGRKFLTYGKRIIEECYGNRICETKNHGFVISKAEYIYGDSVTNYTPVYIKHNEKIHILTIDELADKYGNNNWVLSAEEGKQDKEFCELNDVETWSDKGWTKLYRVIRHILAPHKKIIRILTHTGLVDVTDDHSLVKLNGEEISPKNIDIGTELLHNPLREMTSETKQNVRKGFYDSVEYGLYKKITCSGTGASLSVAKYINGLNGLNVTNYYMDVVNEKIVLTINSIAGGYNPNAVKKMTEIDYTGYVYDLTTENHHFAAGVGNMIVHNTDSVFYTFNLATQDGVPIRGKDALEITIELAQHVGEVAASFLKSPHDFEYEKTFMPFCLLSKKRYVGMLYETDPNKCKRKEMGIVLKRRDNAPIVKDIYGGIIDILMKKQNIPDAVNFLRGALQNVVNEKYPMEKLIITKSLRSGYKNPKSIAHKVLADRMGERDPGNKPGPGDRIPYVYICVPDKKALQGNKIETPSYVIEKGLKLDYSFYITNQIMKPVQQVFALVLEQIWNLQGKVPKIKKYKRDVQALEEKYGDNPEKLDEKIEDLRCKEIKMLLFDEYLRETNNQKEGNQSVTNFFVKK